MFYVFSGTDGIECFVKLKKEEKDRQRNKNRIRGRTWMLNFRSR